MTHNTLIYQVPEPQLKKEVFGWDIEQLHPKDGSPYLTYKPVPGANLAQLLIQAGSSDYYKWVNNKINIPRWNKPDKFMPYNMRILLQRFLPDLFHIYWNPRTQKITQLNYPQICKTGIFTYREMNVKQLRKYVCDQMKRIDLLLNPPRDSMVGKVFNTRWFNPEDFFALHISNYDAESLLTPLVFEGEHVYFNISELGERGFPKVTFGKWKLSLSEEKKPPILDSIQSIVGTVMTSQELNDYLDTINFTAENNNGRIQKLHHLLAPHGIILQKKQKRINGKRTYIYIFLNKKVSFEDSHPINFKQIRNS